MASPVASAALSASLQPIIGARIRMPFSPRFTKRPSEFHVRIPATLVACGFCKALTHYPCFEHRNDPLRSSSPLRHDGNEGPEAFLLRTAFHEMAPPFIFLDPHYSWHGGFLWWHGKLAQVIKTFADERGVSFASARATLAAELASIELLPYHSSKFRDADGWLSRSSRKNRPKF